MEIITSIILWFGMITTGFFAGMGNQVAQYYFENHIKKKLEKIKIKEVKNDIL